MNRNLRFSAIWRTSEAIMSALNICNILKINAISIEFYLFTFYRFHFQNLQRRLPPHKCHVTLKWRQETAWRRRRPRPLTQRKRTTVGPTTGSSSALTSLSVAMSLWIMTPTTAAKPCHQRRQITSTSKRHLHDRRRRKFEQIIWALLFIIYFMKEIKQIVPAILVLFDKRTLYKCSIKKLLMSTFPGQHGYELDKNVHVLTKCDCIHYQDHANNATYLYKEWGFKILNPVLKKTFNLKALKVLRTLYLKRTDLYALPLF